MQPDINNYNVKFFKYPKLVYDKGWRKPSEGVGKGRPKLKKPKKK